MSNLNLAERILRELWRMGVREVALCAGARNAPFVTLLSEQKHFRVHSFFDERSAGFFALGRILGYGRPLAVITTSGTAAAELLPAVIEADYQGQPLILVTADRPRRYRGSGAPQTINQVGLYSHYVEKSWDIESEMPTEMSLSLRRPVHINVCFDEPLIAGGVDPWEPLDELCPVLGEPPCAHKVNVVGRKTLVLVGGLPAAARDLVLSVLARWQRPVWLEGPSNLRGHPSLSEWEVIGGEVSLKNQSFDSVIRIGSVPTLRFWRDLETLNLPVTHFSHLAFSGLPRAPQVNPLASLADISGFEPWDKSEKQEDREMGARLLALLREFPFSEPAWMHWLSRQMPARARVFVGNSLPIREWDFAALRDREFEVFANRGANGIDGLVSTFLGLADPLRSNWCVIGDLSALYDLSGLWAAREGSVSDLNLVVINNGGGRIFHRMFHNPLFENAHTFDFSAWARMWRWEYVRLERPTDLPPATSPRILEIVPDNAATDGFWRQWESM